MGLAICYVLWLNTASIIKIGFLIEFLSCEMKGWQLLIKRLEQSVCSGRREAVCDKSAFFSGDFWLVFGNGLFWYM